MKIRRGQIIFGFFVVMVSIFCSIVFDNGVFGYDTSVAHPNIVGLATEVYNRFSNKKLNTEQINWIKKGAEDEDMPTRWFNHFYDPVHNTGFKSLYSTAKKWSNDAKDQANYALGDYSWDRAIADYRAGNEEQALVGLGHVIHLVSDMTVPAHTRNDAHPTGDSLEQYIKNNWVSLVKNINPNNLQIKYFPNLNDYFDDLANYSNGNFYSDDTIKNSKYKIININNDKIEKNVLGRDKLYKYALSGDHLYRIYVSDVSLSWQSTRDINPVVNDVYILTDYSHILLPQAIQSSAGVIKLFFEEVNKEQNIKLASKRVTLAGRLNYLLGYVINKFEGAGSNTESTVVADNVPVIKNNNEDTKYEGYEITKEIPNEIVPVVVTKIENKIKTIDSEEFVSNAEYEIIPELDEVKLFVTPPIIQPVVAPIISNIPIIPFYYSYGGGAGGGGSNHTEQITENIIQTITTSTDDCRDVACYVFTTTTEIETATTTDDQTPDSNSQTPTTPSSTITSSVEPVIVLPLLVPVLDEQFGLPILTTSTSYNISGSCSPSSTKVIVYSLSTTSTEKIEIGYVNCGDSILNWSTEINLSLGDNYFDFVAQNSVTSSDHSIYVHIILDNEAPAVPVLSILQTDFATPTLNISWTDIPTAVAYDLSYRDETNQNWIPLLITSTSTSAMVEVEKLHTYQFRARSYDSLENISAWSSEANVIIDYPKTVIINEIAWMGTGPYGVNFKQTDDEWIELYNNTDADIDLSNWKLLASGTDLKLKFATSSNNPNLTPIIRAHNYYLIERTDDTSVGGVSADALFTGALNNNGEKMVLKNSLNEIIDEVDCSAGGNKWFNQTDIGKYYTMQRKSSTEPGSLATNWQSGSAYSGQGTPMGGGDLLGTPKLPNVGYAYLNNDLTLFYPNNFNNSAKTWLITKANSPYVIGGEVIIPVGYTLQIDPGVVLFGKYKSSYLKVLGNLVINGTEAEPVIFTSALDSNYIKFGLESFVGTVSPGDWSRIEIRPGASFSASNAKFYYGGNIFFYQTGVFVNKVGRNMSNIIFNLGGTVNLDKVSFENSYFDTDQNTQYNNANVYTEAPIGFSATTTISNSNFNGGYLAVKNNRQDNGQVIYSVLRNNVFTNFSNLLGPIDAGRDVIEMEGNTIL